MTREPDRYEAKADALFAEWARKGGMDRDDLATALRQAADEALERFRDAFDTAWHGGCLLWACQCDEPREEGNCARLRNALASPAAAPAAETRPAAYCVSCGTGLHAEEIHCDACADDLREDEVSQDGTAPPSDPVAPFRDCTCYVVNGEITPESRARCPRHTPVAPSLLPRVLAALERHAGSGHYWEMPHDKSLAAELRRYIERMSNNG